MPHNEYGNYYERGFIESVFIGLLIIVALAVILSLPGWISVAIWGWTWFFRGAAIFWVGAVTVALIVTVLAAIGSDT